MILPVDRTATTNEVALHPQGSFFKKNEIVVLFFGVSKTSVEKPLGNVEIQIFTSPRHHPLF